MCFGPTASFTSAAVLTAAGTVTLKTAQSKSELLLAAFPLMFGIQQFIEGLIWLAVNEGPLKQWLKPFTAAFLLFAYIVWPIISPLAIYLIEPKKKHKWILAIMILTGIGTACYLLWFVFHFPHHANVVRHSIQYHVKKFSTLTGFFYLGSTYIPYLISSHKSVRLLGLANIIAAVVSRIFYWKTFDSVWCFFAAILSVGIYFVLRSLQKSGRENKGVMDGAGLPA